MAPVIEAFETNDLERSKQYVNFAILLSRAHDAKKGKHAEKHTNCGEVVYSIVFGGLDGIITTFSVVTAIVGATLTRADLIVIAVANLIGEAIGMALGDSFSSFAETNQTKSLLAKYTKQYDSQLDAMKVRMSGLLQDRGFSIDQSKVASDYLSENKKLFCEFLLQEEHGVASETNCCGPIKDGIAMFISFIAFGTIPIIPYFFSLTDSKSLCGLDVFFWVSIGLTLIGLFCLGIFQKIIMRKTWYTWWQGGLVILIQGSIAAGLSFLTSYLLQLAMKLDQQ